MQVKTVYHGILLYTKFVFGIQSTTSWKLLIKQATYVLVETPDHSDDGDSEQAVPTRPVERLFVFQLPKPEITQSM